VPQSQAERPREIWASLEEFKSESNFYFQLLTEEMFAAEGQWLELFIEWQIHCRM
jgi:hypothetical protein